ncbi:MULTISPECIES: winged helix-turn-helix domain-containing protein [unclassified Frigoribacterium]|uniref:winged helix-turn-helix domain-containing protein n=1 Tax=unclassified Frigoribacterium TaxID=2627005 RepID=UPI001786B332|nr:MULTISPECIES: winged helix-turn-helix domain-containing protein [unclassified Frigoribacterium]MBD8585135.1 winged helix-turn-helix transcriptional regulator [Frigoribacterium sp. CFBP 8766]MBF4579104.1 winged helix-turn-helix transcriptional regulator [Frigoribacterium sp. VKM Ac-2530]
MSLILDRPVTAARTVSPARTSSTAAPLSRTAAAAAAAATAPAPAEPAAPRTRSLPEGTEARGFALYVGIDEVTAAQTGTELGDIVAQIKALVAQIAPAAETHAAVAIAPTGAGGRDVDVVRLALQDPSAVAARRQAAEVAEEPGARGGVVVDISRKRVLLDGEAANLTYKEFELLQYLVLREGRTIERSELIGGLWADGDDEVPNERTIDVHVRRLRAKLGAFEDVVRTVRGAGYRFDRHADVSIRHASTPSPDLF